MFIAPLARIVCGTLALVLCLTSPTPAAEAVLQETFESPDPTWQLRPVSTRIRLIEQTRTHSSTGRRAVERVVLTCPGGYSAQLQHAVGELPVIDELAFSVMLRSNRAGVQLAAEVVFPRSVDEKSEKPLRTLVHSTRYSQLGHWQSLELSRVPLLAERQARLIRAKPGQEVDAREAYVDRVVLVVPGGPNASVVEIDRLVAAGVQLESSEEAHASGGGLEGPLLQSASGGGDRQNFPPVDIRRRGDLLTVAGKPLVPRLLEHRGESFAQVAQLGFTGVWMHDLPSEAVLRAAHKAKLWVVCPPPEPEALAKIKPTSAWQSVLAWSLGTDRNGLTLDQTTSLAEQTRRNDPLQRPLIVEASNRRRSYAQLADVIVKQSRSPLTARSPSSRRAKNVLPMLGCSPWTSIDLNWSPEATAQCQALLPRAKNLGWHEPRDIYRLALQSVSAGSRGLLIQTREPLGSSGPDARRMALQLQLLNRELALLEPWLVAGKQSSGAEANGVEAITWRVGRSRLVMIPPLPTAASQKPATLALADVSETATAHLITPAGLIPLATNRASRGLHVATGGLHTGDFVLLSDDPRAVAAWKQRTSRGSEEAARSLRMLAMAELLRVESLQSQLAGNPAEVRTALIDPLKKVVEQCDLQLAAKDYPRAVQLARQLRQSVSHEEQRLVAKTLSKSEWQSIPTQYSLRTLPTHVALEDSLRSLPRSANLLAGGDFEGLEQTKTAGWTHANYANSSLATAAQFTTDNPRQGGAALRLVAQPSDLQLATDEAPASVWITSPEVGVRPRSVIEITGWARVTKAEGGNRGELLVIDSLAGEELALRIRDTHDWQPFRMVRTVRNEGKLRLKLALNGPATADVDAVMIREVVQPRHQAAEATTQKGQRK